MHKSMKVSINSQNLRDSIEGIRCFVLKYINKYCKERKYKPNY